MMRLALVGAGRIAQTHLQAIAAVEDTELAAVVDPREAAARPIAEEHAVPWFAAHTAAGLAADAVIVCTPPATHHEVVAHFLTRGIPVLCEKPLDLSAAAARELFELAERHGVPLMTASKFRYVSDVNRAKAAIEAGSLGRIISYENTFCSKVDMTDRWNARPEISGGGVLIDNGTHSVDIARYLLGPIAEVQAVLGTAGQQLEVEDSARLHFRTESGVMGFVDLSWSVQKATSSFIDIYGSEGTLLVGWSSSRQKLDGNPDWVEVGSGYDKLEAFSRQLRNFLDVVAGAAEPLLGTADALAAVRVIEAAYDSARRKSWAPVERRR